MVALQRRGAVQPGHEGGDARPVLRRQAVDRGAVQGFLRQRHLLRVQRFVQVHHELVQAVGAAVPQAGHRGERAGVQQVVLGGRHGFQQRVEPGGDVGVPGGVPGGAPGGQHRRGHHPQVGGDARQQPRGARHEVARALAAGGGDHGVELKVVDAAGDALALQVVGGLLGVIGVRQRGLQQGEGEFDPVVGCQRGVHRPRTAQPVFADRRQHLGLHRISPRIAEAVWR